MSYEDDAYYWEHLGMPEVPSYREKWDQNRCWYEAHGFVDRLITSQDGPDGSIRESTSGHCHRRAGTSRTWQRKAGYC